MPTARIYKILHDEGNSCYYGCTEKSLRWRWYRHKSSFIQFNKGNPTSHNISYYQLMNKRNVRIELVEEFQYAAKQQRKQREHAAIVADIANAVNIYKLG